jgi:hypothetical protein
MLFIQTLAQNGTKELPLEKAKTLFSQIIDLWDRTTLKAYFGTQAHRSTRKMRRTARYATGTYSFKNIELTQDVETTPGYLEKLGLAEIEKRGKTWFFLVRQDAVIVPQLFKNVVVVPSEISLSHPNTRISQGERVRENRFEKVVPLNNELETNNNLQSEREKTGSFLPKAKSDSLELTLLEKAILRSASGDG